MTTTANILNKKRFIAIVVIFLLTNLKMFGQEAQTVPSIDNNVTVASATQSNSQMELVMWIMGPTSRIKSNGVTNTISTNGSAKKKYINTGMTPNRILSKTILKKVSNDQLVA